MAIVKRVKSEICHHSKKVKVIVQNQAYFLNLFGEWF